MRDASFADRYQRASDHDGRADGYFVTGMPMSETFCRPGCSTRTPRPSRVAFFATAAAAHAAGLRPCPRCQPEMTPAPPAVAFGDTVGARALRLIDDGEIDRGGVGAVARRLGISVRHVLRAVEAVAGCGPLDVARADRAHLARLLLTSTTAPMHQVAAAAGFTSVRQFNSTVQRFYGATPGALRFGGRRPATATASPGPLVVRCVLPVRAPFDAEGLFRYLARRAVPEVEESGDTWHARVVRLPHAAGHLRVDVDDRRRILAKLTVADPRDLRALYSRTRRLLDLDADPLRIDRVLAADPLLAPVVTTHPGVRVPGAVDPGEALLRAIVEERLPAGSARTTLGGLASALAEPTQWGLAFPTAERIADHGREVLRGDTDLIETIVTVAAALSTGRLALHWGMSRHELAAQLAPFPGVGAHAADIVAIRVLGARDVLGAAGRDLRAGAERLGLPAGAATLSEHAVLWSPVRSYAAMHLRSAAVDVAAA